MNTFELSLIPIVISNAFDSSRSVLQDGETVVNNIGDIYSTFPHEGLVVNVLGAVLVGLAILLPAILKCDAFRKGLPYEGRNPEDFESQ